MSTDDDLVGVYVEERDGSRRPMLASEYSALPKDLRGQIRKALHDPTRGTGRVSVSWYLVERPRPPG